MSATIELVGLEKVFHPGGIRAVGPVDLCVGAGERLAVLGPSGSGKSTLLRLVAGLEAPTAGEVRIDGRRVDNQPPSARDLAMVFQTPALYPHRNVFENLAFGLRARRVARPEIRRRVDEVAARLGLSDVLRRRPYALSGGQRQRVALGRAFVRRPAVLLLDEPFSALDAPLRADLRAALSELHSAYGSTLLHVTHDQSEALAIGDRLALFEQGRLVAEGEPQGLYDQPPNRFVGAFLGLPPMNFLQVSARREGDRTVVQLSGSEALDFEVPASRMPREGPLVLGIRPEAVQVGEPDQETPMLPARVERVERLGHESVGVLTLDGERIHVRLGPHLPFAPGEPVSCGVPLEEVSWFDPESGIRM
jgi:ABC-type sugar transport system ATPase subunit